jgi:glycosyltransferase involved in cell wall biosynthesis
MKNLTLVIPAKNEEFSLPKVLDEIKDYKCKKIIILEKNDIKTFEAIKRFDCKIIKQKSSGYGSAIIQGINEVRTDYLCIFNADGSFQPKYLKIMLKKISNNFDFIFASRYQGLKSGSDDDTLLTFIGNKIFTLIGNIFFQLKLTDILFTYILGRTYKFKKLKLKSKDFSLCVEIPIKIKKKNFSYSSIPCFERRRIGGKKNVNELIDGFLILMSLIKFLLYKNDK